MEQRITAKHSAAFSAEETKTDCFEDFIRENWEKAVRIAWRLTGEDQQIAEDVAQEAFLKAHKAFSGFRNESKISTWFYRTLVRQAANHRRWRGVRLKWQGLLEAVSPNSTGALSADPFLKKSIASALEQLSPKQRSVFVLTHLEGFTVPQAALVLGCATGTAKSHLYRGIQTLRVELGDVRGGLE